MTSSSDGRRGYSRRFALLAAAIVAVVAAYTAGWHYAAGVLADNVTAAVASLNRDGRRANCEEPDVRGYPFRIGVFCRTVMFEDARGGVGFRARQFRSAAQVYAPRHVIGEIDGPATLEAPGLTALELDWATMRASARLASPVPNRLSVEAKDMTVRLNEAGDSSPLLWRAALVELHTRPVEGDLDVAVRFGGLALGPTVTGLADLPPFRGLIDVQVRDGASLSLAGQGLRGQEGTLRAATIYADDGEAGVTISGPVAVDDAGLIDAQLQVTLHEPEAVAAVLVELFPEFRQEIRLAVSAVASMGDDPTVPMLIRKGEVSLGFFSLGSIPPL